MADDVTVFVDGVVHEVTQVHDGALDLTLASVERLDGGGAVDFGIRTSNCDVRANRNHRFR